MTEDNKSELQPYQELQASEQPIVLTPEQIAERKRKNAVLGWALAGFALLVFLVSMVKLSGNG